MLGLKLKIDQKILEGPDVISLCSEALLDDVGSFGWVCQHLINLPTRYLTGIAKRPTFLPISFQLNIGSNRSYRLSFVLLISSHVTILLGTCIILHLHLWHSFAWHEICKRDQEMIYLEIDHMT